MIWIIAKIISIFVIFVNDNSNVINNCCYDKQEWAAQAPIRAKKRAPSRLNTYSYGISPKFFPMVIAENVCVPIHIIRGFPTECCDKGILFFWFSVFISRLISPFLRKKKKSNNPASNEIISVKSNVTICDFILIIIIIYNENHIISFTLINNAWVD